MLIRGGEYELDQTVVFSLHDSALPGSTITYAAYPNETPVFTSAAPIIGWSKPDRPSPLLPEGYSRRGVDNRNSREPGQRLVVIRWKRPTTSGVVKALSPVAFVDPKTPADQIAFPSGAMKNWPDLGHAELRIIPSCDYEMCLVPLATVDEQAGRAKTAVPASRPMGRVKFLDETAWVENVLEVLDEPGEWVYSRRPQALSVADAAPLGRYPFATPYRITANRRSHSLRQARRSAGHGARIPRIDVHRRRTVAVAR